MKENKKIDFKILSWNVNMPPWNLFRQKKLPFLISEIIEEKVDVIVLQEIFFKSDREYIVNYLKRVGFKYFSHYKNLLTLSKFPLEVVVQKEFYSQGPLFSLAILDRLYRKGFLIVKIKVGGKEIVISNQHLLSADGNEKKVYNDVRLNQLNEIMATVESYPKIKKTDFFIIGDLNFSPKTEPYQHVLKRGFRDISNKIKLTTVYRSVYLNILRRKIDYFFLKSVNKKVKEKVFAKESKFSDHFKLILECSF